MMRARFLLNQFLNYFSPFIYQGAEFQVDSFGWPSGDNIALTFRCINSSVATVNSDGLIHVNAVGDTMLVGQAEVRIESKES